MAECGSGGVVRASVAAGHKLPSDFQTKGIAGASRIEHLRGEDDQPETVLVYFSRRCDARTRAPEIKATLAATATDVQRIVDTRTPPARWTWWPGTLVARIERVIAAAGLVAALVTYWSFFFAAPRATVQVVPNIDVIAGQRLETGLRVVNATDAKTTVVLDSTHPIAFEPAAVVLEPRGEAAVRVRGAGPVAADSHVAVRSRTRAGLFRFSRVDTISATVTAWPRAQVGAPSNYRIYRNGRSLDMTLPLRAGEAAPHGLNCSARILGVPGVLIVGTQPVVELDPPRVNTEPGNELASLRWRTPPVEAFTSGVVSLLFESRVPLSESQWRAIAPQVTCRRRAQ